MAPLSYVKSIKSSRVETVISNDSRTMNAHTTTDVVIILVIFIVLIVSLAVFAWKHPTSLESLRAAPIYGGALPIPDIAVPITTLWRSFPCLAQLRVISLVISNWWMRPSPNPINRIPSITISHNEHPVARAPPIRNPPVSAPSVGSARVSIHTPTPTTTAFTSSSEASSISTTIDSIAIELHELDGVKGLSTSSLVEPDDKV